MGQSVSVAIIGDGYWGRNLARVVEESPVFKLLCVADVAPDRGNCTVDDVLERDDVEAVMIATPATTHNALVLRALAAGKHVLCEKPLALDFEDAEFLCDLADECDLQLMCDHTYVYSPGLQTVRKILDDFDEVTAMWSMRMHHGGPQDVNALWDLLPHDLAISQALTPQWWRTVPLVQAFGSGEFGTAWFGWPEDRRCIVDYSRQNIDGKVRYISLTTRDGHRVRWIDHPSTRIYIETGEHDLVNEVSVPQGEALRNMVEAFALACMTGSPSITSGRSALPLIAAIEQANRQLAE